MMGVLFKGENFDSDKEGECSVRMNTPLWWYLYKPRHDKGCQRTTRSYRRGLEQTFSHSLQRQPILLTPCSQTSRLRNYTVFFYCLSHTICGTFLLLLLLLLLFLNISSNLFFRYKWHIQHGNFFSTIRCSLLFFHFQIFI